MSGDEHQEVIRDCLMEIVRSGAMESVHISDLKRVVLSAYASDRVLSKASFLSLTTDLMSLSDQTRENGGDDDGPTLVPASDNIREEERDRTFTLFLRLFDAFDVHRTNAVDTDEILNALIFLCSGDRDDKLAAGFDLYTDENGTIDESSLTAYLIAMFTVVHATEPERFLSQAMTIAELAVVSAKQCFASVATDRIDFEQFESWYTNRGTSSERTQNGTSSSSSSKTGPFRAMQDELSRRREEQSKLAAAAKRQTRSFVPPVVRLRRAAGLDRCSSFDMLDAFAAESDDSGYVHRDAFFRVFKRLSTSDKWEVSADALYRAIADDGGENKGLDFVEMMTCLCFLASGTLRERLSHVFSVFDLDESNTIRSPRDTTTLLLAILRLPLYGADKTNEHIRRLQHVASAQIEDEAASGHVSFEVFYDWFVAFVDAASVASTIENKSGPVIRSLVRRYRLSMFQPEEVRSILLEGCQDGSISRERFVEAFSLIGDMVGVSTESLDELHALYASFDKDQDGVVTESDIAGGVAALYWE